MSRKIFKVLLIFISFLIGLYILLYFLFSKNLENCKDLNKAYQEFIPYHQNDSLLFIGNNKKIFFVVKQIHLEHTQEYWVYKKCGLCDDYLNIKIESASHTLLIHLENFNNESENQGEILQHNYMNQNYNFIKFNDSLVSNILVLEKNKGITKIKLENQIYYLEKIIKSDSITTVKNNSCS